MHQWIPLAEGPPKKTLTLVARRHGVAPDSTAAEPGVAAYTIDPSRRMVVVRFGKSLHAREISNYANSLRNNPLFDPSFSELVDLSKVEGLEVGPEEAVHLADEADPFLPTAKRAFVVQSSTAAYAARMHMLLRAQNQNIRIFESIDEARQWLQG
ncbi:MAG TPA: hypothetical protein VEF05_06710 [Terriglobales bacterium]|nr:hypothetical protein [Terriglobales bacterium]